MNNTTDLLKKLSALLSGATFEERDNGITIVPQDPSLVTADVYDENDIRFYLALTGAQITPQLEDKINKTYVYGAAKDAKITEQAGRTSVTNGGDNLVVIRAMREERVQLLFASGQSIVLDHTDTISSIMTHVTVSYPNEFDNHADISIAAVKALRGLFYPELSVSPEESRRIKYTREWLSSVIAKGAGNSNPHYWLGLTGDTLSTRFDKSTHAVIEEMSSGVESITVQKIDKGYSKQVKIFDETLYSIVVFSHNDILDTLLTALQCGEDETLIIQLGSKIVRLLDQSWVLKPDEK